MDERTAAPRGTGYAPGRAWLPVLILCLAGVRPSAGAGDLDAFAAARLAPDDVTLMLHVRDAAAIRRELGSRPVAGLLRDVAAGGDVGKAWTALAARVGLDEAALFDMWLGREATLLVRPEAGGSDWVLVTEVPGENGSAVARRLNPRRLSPWRGIPVAEVPEHELRVARDGSTWVFGPTGEGRLFRHVLAVIAGASDTTAPGGLADVPALARARGLGPGRLAVYVRHGPELGGWSVLAADVAGARLRLRHAARFEHAPFARPVPQRPWDMSALDAFEDAALLAVIEPTDIGGGPLESFAMTVLGAPILSRAMRENVADCRIVAIGEVEGRQERPPADLLVPTGALAIRLRDPAGAEGQLDEQIGRLVRAAAAPDVAPPPVGAFRAGERRHLDLDPIMAQFARGLPFLRSVSLNWTIASGPHGSYYVLATHPEHLGRTVAALQAPRRHPPRLGRWANCGTMNGPRVGVHLRSYCDQAALLAAPGAEEDFRTALRRLSDVAGGLDRCAWRLSRPTPDEMDLAVDAVLRASESAGSE